MTTQNTRILLFVAVVIIVASAVTVLSSAASAQNSEQELSDATGIDVSGVEAGGSYWYEVKATEKNQNGLVKAQPPFIMDSSLERENLIRRYQYLNDADNVHHVYLMDEGQVVSYFVAQGKVSSVNSKLTNDKQIVEIPQAEWDTYGGGGAEGANFKVVESPQMDGSYGTNGAGIFFFTTNGQYVESDLDYVVSEEPQNIRSEVILTETAE